MVISNVAKKWVRYVTLSPPTHTHITEHRLGLAKFVPLFFFCFSKRFKVGVSPSHLNEEGCYVYVNRQDGNTFSYHPYF